MTHHYHSASIRPLLTTPVLYEVVAYPDVTGRFRFVLQLRDMVMLSAGVTRCTEGKQLGDQSAPGKEASLVTDGWLDPGIDIRKGSTTDCAVDTR